MSALIRHWELKATALALATALWVFVTSSEKSEMAVVAAVELDSIPAGLEVVGERPETVDVQLHGLRSAVARLPADQVRARVSLAGARPGEVELRLLPEQIAVPPGITVLRVSPSRMRIVLEASRSGTVKVVPRLTGALPEGYRVTNVRVTPAEVVIHGPASKVERIDRIETEPLDLSGVTATVERVAALGGLGAAVRLAGESKVRVVIEVARDGVSGGGHRGGGAGRKGGA